MLSKPWLSERGGWEQVRKRKAKAMALSCHTLAGLITSSWRYRDLGCRCGTVHPVPTPGVCPALESQKAGRRGQGDWVRPSGETGGTWSHARNSPMPRDDVDNSISGIYPTPN